MLRVWDVLGVGSLGCLSLSLSVSLGIKSLGFRVCGWVQRLACGVASMDWHVRGPGVRVGGWLRI